MNAKFVMVIVFVLISVAVVVTSKPITREEVEREQARVREVIDLQFVRAWRSGIRVFVAPGDISREAQDEIFRISRRIDEIYRRTFRFPWPRNGRRR